MNNNNTKKIIIVLASVVVVAVVIVLICMIKLNGLLLSNKAPKPSEQKEEQAVEDSLELSPEEQEETEEEFPLSETERLASYKAFAEASFIETFKDSYEVKADPETKILTVNVWFEGLVQELSLAQMGKQEYIDAWANSKEGVRNTSEKLYNARNNYNLPDYHVSINILNNLNKDNTLLSTYDSIIIYDALNEK